MLFLQEFTDGNLCDLDPESRRQLCSNVLLNVATSHVDAVVLLVTIIVREMSLVRTEDDESKRLPFANLALKIDDDVRRNLTRAYLKERTCTFHIIEPVVGSSYSRMSFSASAQTLVGIKFWWPAAAGCAKRNLKTSSPSR